MSEQRFAWNLSQERLDLLALVLFKAETMTNIAAPGCLAAERIACLATDLRLQCCVHGGACDPFPDTPLFPLFEEAPSDACPLPREKAA